MALTIFNFRNIGIFFVTFNNPKGNLVNKSNLIDAIASHTNLTKADAGRALDGITQSIQAALKARDSVALVG
jgi:hypothetical protein